MLLDGPVLTITPFETKLAVEEPCVLALRTHRTMTSHDTTPGTRTVRVGHTLGPT